MKRLIKWLNGKARVEDAVDDINDRIVAICRLPTTPETFKITTRLLRTKLRLVRLMIGQSAYRGYEGYDRSDYKGYLRSSEGR